MTSITRAKTAIKQIARFDAIDPTGAQLEEMGQASLYHPTARPVWEKILSQNGLVINPLNETVLDDIGTLVGDTFTPITIALKKRAIAALFLRMTRRTWADWLRNYRLKKTNAPAVPLDQARDAILATASTDAAVIVGDDDDDPES